MRLNRHTGQFTVKPRTSLDPVSPYGAVGHPKNIRSLNFRISSEKSQLDHFGEARIEFAQTCQCLVQFDEAFVTFPEGLNIICQRIYLARSTLCCEPSPRMVNEN